MKIAGIHHVAINVNDVDEAISFYTTALRFSVIASRPDFGIPGAWLQAGAQQLHLVGADDFTVDRQQHFALEIDDADAWAEHLTTCGVEVRRATALVGAGNQLFVRDPSGNRIELNQPDAT